MSVTRKIGRPVPLPKFGDWDVNNPASADAFTVIFSKARDERKGTTKSHDGTTNRPANNTGSMESRTTSDRSANTESKQDSRRTEKSSSYDSSRSSSNSAFSKKSSYNSRTAASKKWFCCASPSPTKS